MNGLATLMHKDIPVAQCYFGSNGKLEKIEEIYEEARIPVLASGEENRLIQLQKWISSRTLSMNRTDVAELSGFYGDSALQSQNYISLYDCYWFRKKDDTKWEDVNCRFLMNKEDPVENALLRPNLVNRFTNFGTSPNVTLPGDELRLWYREGRALFLLYGNAKEKMEEYSVAKDLKINMLEREYMFYEDMLFAKIPVLTSEKQECIPFEEYYVAFQKDPKKSKAHNLADCCEFYGIRGWKEFIDDMLHLDETIGNESRDLNDIFVLRDSDTLKPMCFHPL